MKALSVVMLLLLAGCAKPAPKPVVILGNHTMPAVCSNTDAKSAEARAEAWKAYAEKLETQLGIPHEKAHD